MSLIVTTPTLTTINAAMENPRIPSIYLYCLDKEPDYRYLVYAGEFVYLQCSPSKLLIKAEKNTVEWFIQKPDRSLKEVKRRNDLIIHDNGALQISTLERNHSGTYLCRMKNLCRKMIVRVEGKENCSTYGPKSFFFRITEAPTTLSCPSLSCQGDIKRNVTWYRNETFANVTSKNRFSVKINNNDIQFSELFTEDVGIYTCDYVFHDSSEEEWIMRATIQVSVDIPDTEEPPKILSSSNGTEIPAELGKPTELKCRIHFGYERYFNPVIKWTVLHPEVKVEHSGGRNLCLNNTSGLTGYECLFTIKLDKVTKNDLLTIFQCYAQNSVGNVTTTFKLSKKESDVVFLIYILSASVALLLVTLICAGTVYVYWVEIVLLYRHYLSKDETIGDNKDFDAFISYATQTSEYGEEITDNFCNNYEDERFATQLLPSVLEDNYNYKLCILERDILPGGAYVEDIAKIIKRSRRAIFILSQRYITGPRLFELQAAITCSLEEQDSLKLILIKLKPFKEPESLPHIVKKALRALPTVSWKGDLNSKPAHTSKFWKRIRYYMPVKKCKENVRI
ncbi:interleukin-18 receptor accessory protein-like isoform X2 [Hyla sarda]|uniref:interleukin-18 receptor accessory protein-like isoform X2 n=1 Tax=Hyla sarda TaxID=327740 RepID=UPI0024C2269B|nr:interleukin-18 receptor accessory protein-like isoform X2 [Hyla sarda]